MRTGHRASAGGDHAEHIRTTQQYLGYGLFLADLSVAGGCIATTMTVNSPGRQVMERIELRYVRTFHAAFDDPLPGTEYGEVEYALTKEEWLLRRS